MTRHPYAARVHPEDATTHIGRTRDAAIDRAVEEYLDEQLVVFHPTEIIEDMSGLQVEVYADTTWIDELDTEWEDMGDTEWAAMMTDYASREMVDVRLVHDGMGGIDWVAS